MQKYNRSWTFSSVLQQILQWRRETPLETNEWMIPMNEGMNVSHG